MPKRLLPALGATGSNLGGIMFAILAAILFGVALLLELLDTGGEALSAMLYAGLLCLALSLTGVGSGLTVFRRNP